MNIESIFGISARTKRKWRTRHGQFGEDGLMQRCPRPVNTRATVDEYIGQRIAQLRRLRIPLRAIVSGVWRVITVSRGLARCGLSSLNALKPAVPTVRYERKAVGQPLHTDPKNLGRIVRPGHRITGDPRDCVADMYWKQGILRLPLRATIARVAAGKRPALQCIR